MPPYVPGTINIMLWLNGRMTSGAMVNAVQTAVEAKAAALADAGVLDSENGLPATGTTTDAIVIAVGQAVEVEEPQPMITYSGTATTAGAAIGRLVYDTVTESLRAGLLWKERPMVPKAVGESDSDKAGCPTVAEFIEVLISRNTPMITPPMLWDTLSYESHYSYDWMYSRLHEPIFICRLLMVY